MSLVRSVATACAISAFLAATCQAAEPLRGDWLLGPGASASEVRLHLKVSRGGDQLNDNRIWATDALSGLDLAPGAHAVHFAISRDAGTIEFTGHAAGRSGEGTLEFTPSSDYARQLSALGFVVGSDIQQLAFAVYDVSLQYVREIRDLQLRAPTPAQLIAFRVEGVTAALVRELRAAGQRMENSGTVIAFGEQRITPELVAAFHREGCAPGDGTLIAMHASGITPAWIRELNALGYACGDGRRIVALRSLGVNLQFIRRLRQLGISASLAQLGAMRSVGVTPEYVAMLQAHGARNLSAADIIRLRASSTE